MTRVKMWVCDACGGVWHTAVALARGKCPSCGGNGRERACEQDDAGVVHPLKAD